MHRGVMDEVPNAATNEAIGALISLGSFDELLLHCADLTPHAHQAGVLLPVGTGYEASIIRTKGCGEHACAPWPVHVPDMQWFSAAVDCLVLEEQPVCLFDVAACNNAHFLTWVRDLGDGRNWPLIWLLARLVDARVVAITNGIDTGIALVVASPELSIPSLHREVLVHQNPAATTRSLLTQGLLGHKIVRCLHTNAHVLLVGTVGQVNALPEVWILGIVLGVVELLDADLVHVRLAVLGSIGWQRTKWLRQEIDDGQLHSGEEVLNLCGPFHTDEASTHHQHGGRPVVQALQEVELLQDVSATSLQVALVQVGPGAFRSCVFMDGWEPQRLTPLVERTKVTASCNDAVVEIDGFPFRGEDGLVGGCLLLTVQLFDFSPDELAGHTRLNHRLQGEGQGIQVLGLDVSAQDSRSVLEIFLGIDDGHQVVTPQIAARGKP
mmetsp:Transcript_10180/g.16932  ORF Transcript_10180/g.16932 Transcript_10180/m.16932 type:complete len:438 (+) Transcript_10180:123-1436(+)